MNIAQVRQFALSLPEATEEAHFQSASFRVRGKIFATVPPGDELLHVFVSEEEREFALAMEPDFVVTGDAKITRGYRLPAKHVIHTVGPVWQGGAHGEPELLASCYRRSLEIAIENALRTIAFPCISTGVYGYPIEPAASIATATVRHALAGLPMLREVIFCCHSAADLAIYEHLLDDATH